MQSDIVEVICYGIGKMALHNSAAKELTERRCLETVFGDVIDLPRARIIFYTIV